MQTIKSIHMSDEVEFERVVNGFLKDGWTVSSISCGFVNSELYDFCGCYQAILIKEV